MARIKLVKVDDKGKVLNLTEKELQQLLDDAYDEGYKDGKAVGKVEYIPVYTHTPTITPWWQTYYTTSDSKSLEIGDNGAITWSKPDDNVTLL